MKPCDVYEIVDALLKEPSCPSALRENLDDALNAGSSGLEILGSIRMVLIDPVFSGFVDGVLSSRQLTTRKEVAAYIDHLFCR